MKTTWIKTSLFFIALTTLVACGEKAAEETTVTEETTEEVMETPAAEEMAAEETPATTETADEQVKATLSEEAKPAAKTTKTEEVVAPKKSVAKTLSTQSGEEAPATANDRPASE